MTRRAGLSLAMFVVSKTTLCTVLQKTLPTPAHVGGDRHVGFFPLVIQPPRVSRAGLQSLGTLARISPRTSSFSSKPSRTTTKYWEESPSQLAVGSARVWARILQPSRVVYLDSFRSTAEAVGRKQASQVVPCSDASGPSNSSDLSMSEYQGRLWHTAPEDGGPEVDSDYEAYSQQRHSSCLGHCQITFCNRFFNNLRTLDEATTSTKTLDHSPSKTPLVNDLLLNYGPKSKKSQEVAYEPYNVKMLRNCRGDAWYAGQNVDSYAWYGMAMWARKQIGHYPEDPKAGSMKPNRATRRADGSSLNTPPSADIEDDSEGQEVDYEPTEDITHPGYGDKMSVADITIPTLNVSCFDDASVIPGSVFSSDSNQVYNTFCRGAVNNRNQPHWMSDVFGKLTGNEPTGNSRVKRLAHMSLGKRDDGPEQFANWQFRLDWTPGEESFDGAECPLDCPTAFAVLAVTPQCSQKGCGFRSPGVFITTMY
ncbi:hypothetical protein EJ02DRAFT_507644 [Clathrospora elynae]|uniref:Uncharacterized protein n=1 Tax=Clathrospora elynae TaxID=706981 RepID=A0A6A5T4D0_9PLEO|nr:hypothetical protein EJ02DRAFT_507644 [Clathrospora elynae]